eukprot:gene1188-1298_t
MKDFTGKSPMFKPLTYQMWACFVFLAVLCSLPHSLGLTLPRSGGMLNALRTLALPLPVPFKQSFQLYYHPLEGSDLYTPLKERPEVTPWSCVDSALLLRAVEEVGELAWDRIAKIYLPWKSPQECSERWEAMLEYGPFLLPPRKPSPPSSSSSSSRDSDSSLSTKPKSNRTKMRKASKRRFGMSGERCRWTDEEIDRLKAIVLSYGESIWPSISQYIPGKSRAACQSKWNRLLALGGEELEAWKRHAKLIWSPEDDRLLHEAIQTLGTRSWKSISDAVPGKTAAQCVGRWYRLRRLNQLEEKKSTKKTTHRANGVVLL